MSLLFGIERQFSNKPAGFGTFIFVTTGACTLGAVSLILSPDNMLIIVGGVVTGIGFLGAGALIKASDKIFGFTTAASIWIFSIIGLSIGLEQYILGFITYLIVWLVIGIDKLLEYKGVGSYQRKIIIRTKIIVKKDEIIPVFKNYKWKLLHLEIDKKKKRSTVSYLLSCPRSYIKDLKESLMKKSWIESFRIE
jgi:putative Mg2+ transporter-C (MgtC) family protein